MLSCARVSIQLFIPVMIHKSLLNFYTPCLKACCWFSGQNNTPLLVCIMTSPSGQQYMVPLNLNYSHGGLMQYSTVSSSLESNLGRTTATMVPTMTNAQRVDHDNIASLLVGINAKLDMLSQKIDAVNATIISQMHLIEVLSQNFGRKIDQDQSWLLQNSKFFLDTPNRETLLRRSKERSP